MKKNELENARQDNVAGFGFALAMYGPKAVILDCLGIILVSMFWFAWPWFIPAAMVLLLGIMTTVLVFAGGVGAVRGTCPRCKNSVLSVVPFEENKTNVCDRCGIVYSIPDELRSEPEPEEKDPLEEKFAKYRKCRK